MLLSVLIKDSLLYESPLLLNILESHVYVKASSAAIAITPALPYARALVASK